MDNDKKDKLYDELYEAVLVELVLGAILFIALGIKDVQKYFLIYNDNMTLLMIFCLLLMMTVLTCIIAPILFKLIN